MSIENSWSFKELVFNIKRLKQEYIFFLAFFSCIDDLEHLKIRNTYTKEIRDKFYSLDINERYIDVAWEYMNDYLTYNDLLYYLYQLDKRKKR